MARRKRSKPEVAGVTSSKWVNTSITLSGETIEEDAQVTIKAEVFETDPAYVKASAGLTKSLGNYEFLRVDAGITMPCYPGVVRETYEAIADEVSELLYNEVDKYIEGEGNG